MGQCCVNQQLQALEQQQNESSPLKDNDISKKIEIIRDSGTSSKAPLSNLFDDNPDTFWYSDGIKNIFYIIDIGVNGIIDEIEITFSPVLYCSDMTILIPINNDPFDDNNKNWKQIIKRTKMNNGYNKIVFNKNLYTNSDESFRYIKLSFDTIKGKSIAGGGQLGVEKLKIFGTMGKIIKKQKTKMYLSDNIYNISSKIKVISNSKAFSNSDNINNICNSELSYWTSHKMNNKENVWIIFDCNNCKLKEIDFVFHNKYVCKTITIETSDTETENFKVIPELKEKSIKQIIFNEMTDVINKRFIKIIFNDMPKLYLCLEQIKFYGNDSNGNDEMKNINEEEKEEKKTEEKQEEEEEEEEDNEFEDITSCFSINLIKHVGNFDNVNFKIKNIFTYDNTYWCSPNRCEMKGDDKDIYMIFDVKECLINRIDVLYGHNKDAHTNTIYIFTSDTMDDDNKWEKIGERKRLKHGEINKIKMNNENKRYIKILLDDFEDIRFGALTYLKFMGKEPNQENDMTNNLKICECSQGIFGTDVNDILIKNTKFWGSADNKQAWIVFDCKYYEIECIKVKFVESNGKCGEIKIGMSNVKNVYNFKEDCLSINLLEKDEKRENLIEEIIIDKNIYQKNGFHRYLIVRFDNNISNVSIEQLRLYGTKSENISDEILYELEKEQVNEQKVDNGIKFGDLPIVLVSNSPGFVNPQFKIEHLWSDEQCCWVSEHKTQKVYFTFDMLKHKVKQIEITLNQQYPCKTCKVFTGDTKLKKEMKEICVMDKFNETPQDIRKPRIIKLNENHKQFIRIEFMEITTDFFGLERYRFVGDELDEEFKELTIDDLYEGCDEDLVHKYLTQLGKQQAYEIAEAQKIDAEIVKKDGNNLGSEEWQQHKKKSLQITVDYLYLQSQAKSKLCLTQFEEDRFMKFAEKQRQLKQEAVNRQFKVELEAMQKMAVSKVKIEKTLKEYQKLLADGKQMKAGIKFVQYQTMLQQEQIKAQQLMQFLEVDNLKDLIELIGEKDKKRVFDEWCDSIDNHPMILSSKYNVYEYESVCQWGIKKKEFGEEAVKARHKKLANLLDECFEERNRKMHKFHMFLLSTTYPLARPPGYKKICWLLLDCNDRNIKRIEIKLQAALQCKKINIYSCDEYNTDCKQEEKGNDDEKWKDFELIGTEVIVKDSDAAQGGMAQMMQMVAMAQLGQNNALRGIEKFNTIELSGNHKRYVKIEFEDFIMQQFVGVERLKIYTEKNEDEKNNELYDEDFQLKIVEESTRWNSISGAINIYKKDSDYFWRTRTELNGADDKGYIIFETNSKKINKIEFLVENGYPCDIFNVYQSDEMDKNWKEICTQNGNINANDVNVISFNSSKKKYIKIEVIQTNNDLSYMGINYIKFFGESKSKLINIASQIKIISNSGTFADPNIVIDNMYIADPKYIWMNSNELKNPSLDVENKIRDNVCKTLNELRNGGDITKNEKHFCKFLLCWQCKTHYSEILATAKAVMTILRKPLDEEYERLTNINSEILTLKLSVNDKCANNIKSNREILSGVYNHWYKFRKAVFYPNDLKKLGEEWVKIGLCDEVPTFKEIVRETVQFNLGNDSDEKEELKVFTDCDQIAMDFLNRIASKLDKSFQKQMKIIFNKNRKQMNLKDLSDNNNIELGVLSGPIKTKARQSIKIKLDYNIEPHPRCMSVLDIVRCAIICENDTELISLFNLLCKEYSGNILRVKNAFNPEIVNRSFGYRAVLINIIFNDENILPKEYSMICEVQLLLSKYYQVRKKMHLGYTICRSEEGGIAEKKQPYYVLSSDCCKFGTLDI